MAIKIKDKNGNIIQVAGVGKPGTPGQNGTSAYQAAVAGGYTGTEEDFNERMAKGVFVGTGTALATGWTGQQNTVTITGLPASVTGIVGVSGSAGDDAWQAAVAAVLRPVSQAAGSVTIKALGTPPDVDIPISIYYWPDTGSPVLLSMFPGTGEQIPLDAPTGFTGTAGNAQVTLTWTDPKDKYATPEGETTEEGDQLVSEWAYTRIIRKTGSAPTGPNDGVLVVESSVRDQYASTGYVDSGLTNGTTYYYGAYAYNKDGVASEGAVTGGLTPKAGTAVSTLAVGTLVKIKENGSPVEYMVVHQGLPSSMYDESCNGCWLVRKDIAENRIWDDLNNNYAPSDIQAYINGGWESRYEAGIMSQIKQVKIPYMNGFGNNGTIASGANGLSCKFFLLSGYEVGLSSSQSVYMPVDGEKLSYFDAGTEDSANSKRIASYNGAPAMWWFRTPETHYSSLVCICYGSGILGSQVHDNAVGLRPACILPSDALVDENLNVIPA